MADNNLQAGGTNKPKSGSLWQKALSTYKQARQKTGTLKEAWDHARKPSAIDLAKAHRSNQRKLKRLAMAHAEGKLGKKGH